MSVTAIGLGLAALGRPGYINIGHSDDLQGLEIDSLQNQTHRVLDDAWELGIRYFDAARSYGLAERFLGSWLAARSISAAEVTVGSKWGYTYTAAWQVQAQEHEVKQHSLSVLKRQTHESRKELGLHLDLYQIHSATLDSGVLENAAVLGELARLKTGGLQIGLSLSGPQQAETLTKALRIEHAGQPLFDTVQATWNVLESSAGAVLMEAHLAGMGIIIKEALANGRLTARNTQPSFAKQLELLSALAETYDCSMDAIALAYILAQDWVDVVLSGASTPEQLRSNVQALQVKLAPSDRAALSELSESPHEYWRFRSSLVWN